MYWKPSPLLYPPYLRNRIKRHRGVDSGSLYVPWLKARDVPSRGTSSVVRGIVSGRPHHLLSELEAIYFFLLERRATTVDIREQWPILDIDRTLELCSQFGVRHAVRNGYPEPFTIDFLITEKIDGELKYRAASIKSAKDAQNPRVRLRLAVEYAWCQERGIPWTLVDTSQFDRTLLQNLRFLRSWFRHQYVPDSVLENQFMDRFKTVYEPNCPLNRLLNQISTSLKRPRPLIEDSFRYCAWSGRFQPLMEHRLALNTPVMLQRSLTYA